VHSIIDELRQREKKAIETLARKGNSCNPSGPVERYLRNGFKIHRDDQEFPLMRLDLLAESWLTQHQTRAPEADSPNSSATAQGLSTTKRYTE